jgi:hypothetical protein
MFVSPCHSFNSVVDGLSHCTVFLRAPVVNVEMTFQFATISPNSLSLEIKEKEDWPEAL